MRKALIAAALLLLAGGRAAAETIVADSLEWMAVEADVIVKGQVTGWKDTPGPGSVVYRDVTVKVEEALKGQKALKTATVRLRLFKGDKTGTDWKRPDRAYLFFLREGKKDEEKGLAGRLTPRSALGAPAVIDLREPKWAFGADLKRLTDPQTILARTQEHARHSPATRPRRRIEVPFASELHRELYAGSACYLIVPAPPLRK